MPPTAVITFTSVTPNVEDLLRNTDLPCTIRGCQSVFKNAGNLQMHLEKHHKQPSNSSKDTPQRLFFCPQIDCNYNEKSSSRKHFKNLKYLRQHYRKVHAEKCFQCTKCNKGFGTESLRNTHERNCGKYFTCTECGWTYDTPEALSTHAKRKRHQQKRKAEEQLKQEDMPLMEEEEFKPVIPKSINQETQTETNTGIALPPKKRMKIAISPEVNPFPETSLCDIETQTELNLFTGLYDPMEYSHMHTQTCDELLSMLEIANIQTQTNWSTVDDDEIRLSSRKEPFTSGAHDELMVSTETQTSFTQYLLDSCTEENSLSGCITQHTQTCEMMEGWFDLIGCFQSTHTQT